MSDLITIKKFKSNQRCCVPQDRKSAMQVRTRCLVASVSQKQIIMTEM